MNITHSIVKERDRALLGGDYGNYHAQATRKIHALRRRLGNATPRGRKYSPKPPVTAENVAQNAEWVQLLLASSERAWADAMTMKSTQSPENTQRLMASSTKKQIVSRHRRAITYAANLIEILSNSSSKANSTDLLEAKAYHALLKGGLDFEKSHWTSCIQNYAVARQIYVALNRSTNNDIYRDILSETVDPSIKYAAYQSKLPRTKAVSDIAIENFPTSDTITKADIESLDAKAFSTSVEKAASARSDAPSNLPTSITWRSRTVQIEDASVSQALGVSQDRETALGTSFSNFQDGQLGSKELATAYEGVIDARQEAVDITKSVIDELRSQGIDQGDSRIQSLQIIRTAVNYAVIEWRIGRNRVLCGKDDGLTFEAETPKSDLKPRKDGKSRVAKEESSGRKLARLRERVALYNSILQSLVAIKELPGVIADTSLVEEIDGKSAYFRALKCLAVGRSHSLDDDVEKSLALFSRANDLATQSESRAPATTPTNGLTKLDVSQTHIQSVRRHLAALTTQYRALVELKGLNGSKVSKETTQLSPLIERFGLNQYDANASPENFVNYPPKLQPIPVKPLFFDLAWNYIQYPGQQQEAVELVVEQGVPEKKEDKPAKKGWFGFGR